MTSGQRLDTNSRWLSQQLADLGVVTIRHTTVADDLSSNIEVFQSAAGRADVVIATGGLGPTLDDLTRDALSEAFQLPLELDTGSLQHIEQLFASRRRPMPERNRVQAMLPRGSRVIPNPHGTAPGIDLTVGRVEGTTCRIFALPGVPAEMTEMWQGSVRERILDMLGRDRTPWMFHVIKLFGIGESDVEERLPDLMRRDRLPRVGITVSRATISLRIAAQARSAGEFQALIADTVAQIEQALGVLIFGQGEDELEHAILRQLRSRSASLAVIEIGPAALASDWLLSACAQEDLHRIRVMSFGSIAQAMATVSALAGYQISTLPELASAIRELLATDYALAFGTYATTEQLCHPRPAASVEVALSGHGMPTEIRSRAIIGHPDILNDRVAKTALDTLRLQLSHH